VIGSRNEKSEHGKVNEWREAPGVRFHGNGSRIFHQMALALGHNTRDSEPSRLRVRQTPRRGVGATGAQGAIRG
jgi:hypothetical protein